MEAKLFVIHDKKADLYQKPFCANNEIDAVRGLQSAMQDPQIQLSMFSDDFVLYEIGTIDLKTAKITLETPSPRFVISASTLKNINQKG